jgi:cytochrome c2
MKFAPKTAGFVSTVALALALAACGGGADEADAPADAVATGAAATPSAEETTAPGETPIPGATPTETPSATPTPSPTPTPAATTAAAAKPAEFAVCAACHSTEPGKNGIGPTLAGVFGARAGHIDGFDYSEAMENSGLTWNQANLDRYLADPKGVVPGTKMAYPGLKDAAKRRAMIDYLKTL